MYTHKNYLEFFELLKYIKNKLQIKRANARESQNASSSFVAYVKDKKIS
jgi:hypothetical protein